MRSRRGLRDRFARERDVRRQHAFEPGLGEDDAARARRCERLSPDVTASARWSAIKRRRTIPSRLATQRRPRAPDHDRSGMPPGRRDDRQGSRRLDATGASTLLFIENVGNLICPAEYDLGEDLRVVLFSVTEGEDKPLKYPLAFNRSQVVVDHEESTSRDAVGYDRAAATASIEQVNPQALRFSNSRHARASEWRPGSRCSKSAFWRSRSLRRRDCEAAMIPARRRLLARLGAAEPSLYGFALRRGTERRTSRPLGRAASNATRSATAARSRA